MSDSNKKTKPQIIETASGRRVRATYSPTSGEWLLTLEPLPSGKRGRPKQNTTYVTALMLSQLRRSGWKWDAALEAVAEQRNIDRRTVLRHWNKHKDKFALFQPLPE